MQRSVNSTNVINFGVKLKFDIYNRNILFDTSGLTTYNGAGAANVLGIAFSVQDQDGIDLATIDWTAPQILHPNLTPTWTLDLSSFNYSFLFQTYKITAAIKEANGTIYTIPAVYKTICFPTNLTESGYVPSLFNLQVDCVNNTLVVKELTTLTYNNQTPSSVTKTGSLNYPTGTIAPINFANTPFSNNIVYSGHYNITCTTVAEYNFGDDVYVDITYLTRCSFDVTCTSRISNLICCLVSLQQTAIKQCNTSIGQRAKQQLDQVSIPFLIGLTKEINGQDATEEAELIKKTLNCDCGSTSVNQNEPTPINPSIYNIVLSGVGGTTINPPSVIGTTKTFVVATNVFQVVKGNTGDLAFSIATDTATQYLTKYKITFDYNKLAASVYAATALDQTLINQLNALINLTNINIDLTGLNGKCVIDLSSVDYFLSLKTQSNQNTVKNIIVGSTTYSAPLGLLVSNTIGIEGWLNSLGKGTYSVTYSSAAYINVLTKGNPNSVVSMTFTMDVDTTIAFQRTNKSLVAVLQAFIDYLCAITSIKIGLSRVLGLCFFNYDGGVLTSNYNTNNNQDDFNAGVASAICNIVNRINQLSAITCNSIKAVFADSPGGSFTNADRIFGTLNGICAGLTDQQLANAVIGAINKYSDVKNSFCNINCADPSTCPDVSNISLSMAGNNIGFYGVTWSQTPIATQSVTIKYRISGTVNWSTATSGLNILPNGNLSGTSPYTINNPQSGQTYDVWVQNNCGGSGFVKQITVPTQGVYSGSFLLDSNIYNICGDTPVTLYSSVPFGVGVTMYTNVGLTTPITGYTFIAPTTSGQIYSLNTSTGVVGAATGNTCASGTAGTYILGNNTGTICSGTLQTLYTNGGFAIGSVLYLDSALTTPVSGNSYVVNMGNNHIYNLNNVTGVIGSDTGLSCTGNTVQVVNNMGGTQITNVTGISGFTPSPAFPISAGQTSVGSHGGFTGAINVVISGTPVINPANLTLERNGVILQTISVTGAATYNFNSFVYVASDTIKVALHV